MIKKDPNNIKIGKLGEEIVNNYLIKSGWQILCRNYKRRSDEVDIIGKEPGGMLVFCEVKTLIIGGRLTPEDNMSRLKYRRISRTCEFFARRYPCFVDEDVGWRIDLFAVDLDRALSPLGIRHYENI